MTTRKPRPGEVDGRDYYFVDEAKFIAMRDAGGLLEWARVFDNFYGTPREPIEAAIRQGRDVLFDIDWQGTQQLAERMAGDLVRVFILPPSAAALEARLQIARARIRPRSSQSAWRRRRPRSATGPEYDYVIVNADLDESIAGLRSILAAERLKRDRMTGLSAFVRNLQQALYRP